MSATWHPRAGSVELRNDVRQPSLAREGALAGAPDGLFRVPKAIG